MCAEGQVLARARARVCVCATCGFVNIVTQFSSHKGNTDTQFTSVSPLAEPAPSVATPPSPATTNTPLSTPGDSTSAEGRGQRALLSCPKARRAPRAMVCSRSAPRVDLAYAKIGAPIFF